MKCGRSDYLFLLILITLLAGISAAVWDVKTLGSPYNKLDVSNNTSTVKVVNLSDNNDEAVELSKLENEADTDLYYIYNSSSGNRVKMNYLSNGYYYTQFDVNSSEGLNITYDLFDSSATGGSIDNESQLMNHGNMTVDLMTDFSGKFNPDNEFDIKVNVTDSWNDTFEDEANVEFYLTNISWTSQTYDINNFGDLDSDGNDDHYRYLQLSLNLDHNSTYVVTANASNSSLGYSNSFGSESVILETESSLKGKIQNLNTSSGCNNESFFIECQRGAELDTSYNITESTADQVNLSVMLWNSSEKSWEEESTKKLSKDSGLYTGSVTVPDIDSSAYDKKFQLLYNASKESQNSIERYNISYRSFKTRFLSSSNTNPGSYDVRLEFRKYFTPELISKDRINSTVNITNQDTDEELTAFNLSDMNKDTVNNYYQREIDIPFDSESGFYDVKVNTTNKYGENKLNTYQFNLSDVEQTFSVDDFETEINNTGNFTYNYSVENMVTSEVDIHYHITGGIEEITSLNDGENLTVAAGEISDFNLSFEVESVKDREGEIKFMDQDSDFNQTADIDIDSRNCDYRNESICIETDGLNTSYDQRESVIKSFDLFNMGPKDSETVFNFEVTGNLSDQVTVDPESATLDLKDRSEYVELNYTLEEPGYYTGDIEISNDMNTLEIPLELDSNVPSTEATFTVSPGDIEAGDTETGSSITETLTVENTGDLEITETNVSSDSLAVSGTTGSIQTGGSKDLELEIEEVETSSAEITVEASTDSGELTETVSFSANIIEDYVSTADSLESQLTDLDSQVTETDLQNQISSAQLKVQDIKTAYRNQNYDEASNLAEEVSSTIDTVESQMSSESTDPVSTTNSTDSSTEGNDNGGTGILVVAIGVIIVLLIGFIAYSSIELEEGDPLYNVLGQ